MMTKDEGSDKEDEGVEREKYEIDGRGLAKCWAQVTEIQGFVLIVFLPSNVFKFSWWCICVPIVTEIFW